MRRDGRFKPGNSSGRWSKAPQPRAVSQLGETSSRDPPPQPTAATCRQGPRGDSPKRLVPGAATLLLDTRDTVAFSSLSQSCRQGPRPCATPAPRNGSMKGLASQGLHLNDGGTTRLQAVAQDLAAARGHALTASGQNRRPCGTDSAPSEIADAVGG